MQARLCSAPSAQAAVILAAGFIGAGMRLAGAACPSRRGPAGPRLRGGASREGLGAVGASGDPPSPPRAGEVLFLGSRAGATALPAPSAPACKSGGDDKWRRGIWAGSRRRCRAGAVFSLRQSHPEQGRDTQEPQGRAKGTGWMVLGSPDPPGSTAWGRQNWGTGTRPPGDGGAAVGPAVDLRRGRGCPVWGTEMCWAVQRCRPCRERGVGSCSSSSSSSLKLFEEAISGRAGNSYHSLLTPGRQEGESASPPHPHRARRAGTTRPRGTPKQGHGVPQGGGHPSVLTPVPTATPNPSG